ncbi:MAG: cellulase family glycosylhydrolase [Prevotella sp.]|nr:cellulase family glycosylhydrolase [Prevotella sp.]
MKLKNIFNTALLFVTALTILNCTDVENEPSYTGRSSGPATKLNVKRDSVDVGDALQFSMGSSSIILGVECDGDWTAEVSGADWADVSNHAGYGFLDRWSFLRLTIQKNEGEARSTTLTFKSGSMTKTITINQRGTGTDAGDSFPSSFATLEDLKLGYNLGNTLDSWPVGSWWDPTTKSPTDWEQGWGQPITTPEIINAIAAKGFNIIRVPVTWGPHMDADGNVDAAWMARVKEVVDMVLAANCYCIVNVMHDTGASETAWLIADMDIYPTASVKYKKLWTQIANTFRDYGDHLLFECFNEILYCNNNNGWTAPAAGNGCYEAIRRYHQDFVDAVRATGGNNEYRNLIINPYSSTSTQTALDEMAVPTDVHPNHIMMSIHSYDTYNFCNDNGEWSILVFDQSCRDEIDAVFTRVFKRAGELGIPAFFGEFGAIDGKKEPGERIKYAKYLKEKFTQYQTTGLWWMGLIDRKTLEWNESEVVDALFQ